MAQLATISPLNQFFALDGSPLNNGKLYFGEINADPEQYPVQMYWDSAGLVPALQPIRTTSGYPSRSGSPAILYCPTEYSLRVRQSNDVQVFYVPRIGSLSVQAFTQFQPTTVTPSFVSVNTFTLTGDQRADFQVGRRAQFLTTAGLVYGTIASSTYGSLTTVVMTMDGTSVLDAGLSAVNLSILTPQNTALPAPYDKRARGYFNGFPLSTAGASATLTIGAGQASDNTSVETLQLLTSLAKTTSAWAVGSGNGGLDEGVIAASAWYAAYIIKRTDTGVNDVVLSKSSGNTGTATITIASPGVVTWTAHGQQVGSGIVFSTTGALPTGLVAGTRYYVIAAGLTVNAFQLSTTIGGAAINTSGTQSGVHTASAPPLLPANYGYYVYAGSNKTDGSSQWVKGIQNGNLVTLDVAVRDVNQNNPGTSAVTQALASVPLGVKVKARILAGVINTGGGDTALITDLDTTAAAPVLGNVPGVTLVSTGAAYAYAEKTIVTNTSQAVRYQVSGGTATTTIHFITTGWEYIR